MKSLFTTLLTAVWMFNGLMAQEVSLSPDNKLPLTPLNDTTELSVLHSRFGSRFSQSLIFGDAGIHTGSLGYDLDAFSEMLLGVEVNGRTYTFNTASINRDVALLENQHMIFGPTTIKLVGNTPEGIKVTAYLVSPFTPSASLEDTVNLKVQISPAFYVVMDLKNEGETAMKCTALMGIQRIPYQLGRGSSMPSWRYDGRATDELYFKDIGVGEDTYLSLAGVSKGMKHHIKVNSFHCIASKPLNLNQGASAMDTTIYASYHAGKVQYDKQFNTPLRFYYTKFWKSIGDVVAYARAEANQNLKLSGLFENILRRSKLSPEEKWVVALTFRNDHANAFLLLDNDDEPRFILLEGRFRHQSTIDVAHETEINAIFSPWRLKLQIEQWLNHMARREVMTKNFETEWGNEQHKEGMSASEYGPFLYHDIGDFPFLAPTSEYNFGPHMAVEENSTFTLLLYWYWKLTGDDEFVKSQLGMVDILLYSLTNRDTDGSGLADKGMGWSTYDVSDAIKRSPENVYLGIKQLCAYEVAAEMFEKLAVKSTGNGMIDDVKDVKDGDGVGFKNAELDNEFLRMKQAKTYRTEASKIVKSLTKAYKKYKYIPVSLETSFNGWDQHSIVLPEGLFLPGLSGFSSSRLDKLTPLLAKSYQMAYDKSQTPYGIKLSSEEAVTWFSKVMVSDIVAGYWFDKDVSTANYTYEWNKNNADAYNDGVERSGHKWIGFWYPRGISSLGYLLKEASFTAPKRNEFLKGLK